MMREYEEQDEYGFPVRDPHQWWQEQLRAATEAQDKYQKLVQELAPSDPNRLDLDPADKKLLRAMGIKP